MVGAGVSSAWTILVISTGMPASRHSLRYCVVCPPSEREEYLMPCFIPARASLMSAFFCSMRSSRSLINFSDGGGVLKGFVELQFVL